MWKFVAGLLLLSCFSLVKATEVKEINWQDLIPQADFEDPYEVLTEDQLYDLGTIVRTREFLKSNSSSVSEDMIARAEELEKKLDEQGVDVDGLIGMRDEVAEKRRAQSMAVVQELNGEVVRMPGYVLPLEFDGEKVTEFFLVPYVGACIHVPPPPPNQMVHVSTDPGIESKELYEPVWVEGIIATKGKTSAFNSFDGILDVSAGYTMKATEVVPYEY